MKETGLWRGLRFCRDAAIGLVNRLELGPEPNLGSEPHMDPAAYQRWRECIQRARVYLEYGAGASTVQAASVVPVVVTVETHKRFLGAVHRRVAAAAPSCRFHPVHVDVGWTAKWGNPVLTRPTEARLERWRKYPGAPWDRLDRLGAVPDFIFVDGRFRIASVLESFLRLPDDADCQFMLDDFAARSDVYGVILDHAEAVEPAGRAICFHRKMGLDRHACSSALERHYADWL